jgi:hypothetical protein
LEDRNNAMQKLWLGLFLALGFGGDACGQDCLWPHEPAAIAVATLQPLYCSGSRQVFVKVSAFQTGGAVTAFIAAHPQREPLAMTPCKGTKPPPPAPVRIASAPHGRPPPIAAVKPARKPAKPAIVLVQI